jgi:hypothetical protein
MSARWCLAAAFTMGATGTAAPAYAELPESVQRVADAWRGVGAAVAVDKSRFLEDDRDDRHPIAIALPELPDGDCTTIVFLGARGLGFHVRFAEPGGDEPKRFPSIAGAVSIERCGGRPPRRLLVASDSGRGAIETVIARSAKPLPPLRAVLPERTGGSILPAADPGTLPPLPAPEKRAEIAESRAKRDGAVVSTRTTWQAGGDGNGAGEQTLSAGCHVLQLFALDPRAAHPSRRGKLDLDAEMRDQVRDQADDRLMARDRTDAPDAQLGACVGESTQVSVVFTGSPPAAPVLVSHLAWPLPEHLPGVWGSEARGRMAHVILARHVVSLPREAVFLGQGGSGITPVPLSIEPGACYLALVTPVSPGARAIGLRVQVGAMAAVDERGIDDDGSAVAFCAGNRRRALAEVEARGTPMLAWGLALFRLQSGIWEGGTR